MPATIIFEYQTSNAGLGYCLEEIGARLPGFCNVIFLLTVENIC